MTKYGKRITCALLGLAILFSPFQVNVEAEVGNVGQYYYDSANFSDDKLLKGVEPVVVSPSDVPDGSEGVRLVSEDESFGYGKSVFSFNTSSKLELSVEVPKAGGYVVYMDYYITSQEFYDLIISMMINDEYQFFDSKSLPLTVSWTDESRDYKLDDFGNDISPKPKRIMKWNGSYLNSETYLLKTPFVFMFEKGINKITIENNEIPFLLGDIRIEGRPELSKAADYTSKNSGKSFGTDFVVIEGEHYSEKSHSYIRSSKSADPNLTPYEPPYQRVNALSANSWYEAGEAVTYDFDIENDGLYYITVKNDVSRIKNKPAYKNIYVDGMKIDELYNYKFDFSNKYVNTTISIDGEPIPFYFEKGTHSLKLETTADVFYDANENLLKIINRINELSMEIKYVTGGKIDKNRDWEIDTYIPGIKDELLGFADDLQKQYDSLSKVFGDNNKSNISNLIVAKDLTLKFSEDLNYLVNNLESFSQGGSSIVAYISLVIDNMLLQLMSIDKIYVTGDLDSIPNASVGFFKSVTEGAKKFIFSFTTKSDQSGVTDENALNVWVGKSAMHVELMREKFAEIDDEYDLPIKLSAMGDEQKLLLSVAAGTAPDLVIGASNYKPFDFALRGAIKDLREYDDFATIIGDYHPEMFVPFIINDSCYAIPEAVDFQVMYYRKDIMSQLGLEVPKTWNDLIAILPDLSRMNMSFSSPIATAGGTKHFGTTIPFIQQFEGPIYNENGTGIEFGDPKTVEAFKFMTDLYTKYSLPENVPNFYASFKRGVTPIGISNIQTYYLLKFGAPELTGQWGVAPSLGVENEKGEILNYQPSVASCSMILSTTKHPEEAWQILKWWMSEDNQVNYANDLQMKFGPQFVHNTANLKAFAKNKSLPIEVREVVMQQLNSTKEIPRNPAYFAVERELSNAWNKVVFDGVSQREALDACIMTSNREIIKKLKEFGYMDDKGNLIKPFRTGTAEVVESWKAGK